MYRLLIATDDDVFGYSVRKDLVLAGHLVSVTRLTGTGWQEAAADQPPMAVLADFRRPGIAPEVFAERMRGDLSRLGLADVPLIGVLARESLAKSPVIPGAAEMLIHPFEAEELLLRVAQCLNRSQKTEDGRRIQIDGLVIDQDAYCVTVDGAAVELTYKEFELLRYLASRRGRAFSREALLAQVWGYGYYGGTRTVDVHIRRIRNKIGPRYETRVQTVRNVGYRFEEAGSRQSGGPDVFLAGVMQGSHTGRGLHEQDYRDELRTLLARHAPAADVYDPWESHSDSIEYDDTRGQSVFLHHLDLLRQCRLVVCYLPTASMGTAIEMWEAHAAGAQVWTISPMDANWIVRFYSHRVFADLTEFEKALIGGALEEIGLG